MPKGVYNFLLKHCKYLCMHILIDIGASLKMERWMLLQASIIWIKLLVFIEIIISVYWFKKFKFPSKFEFQCVWGPEQYTRQLHRMFNRDNITHQHHTSILLAALCNIKLRNRFVWPLGKIIFKALWIDSNVIGNGGDVCSEKQQLLPQRDGNLWQLKHMKEIK